MCHEREQDGTNRQLLEIAERDDPLDVSTTENESARMLVGVFQEGQNARIRRDEDRFMEPRHCLLNESVATLDLSTIQEARNGAGFPDGNVVEGLDFVTAADIIQAVGSVARLEVECRDQ